MNQVDKGNLRPRGHFVTCIKAKQAIISEGQFCNVNYNESLLKTAGNTQKFDNFFVGPFCLDKLGEPDVMSNNTLGCQKKTFLWFKPSFLKNHGTN